MQIRRQFCGCPDRVLESFLDHGRRSLVRQIGAANVARGPQGARGVESGDRRLQRAFADTKPRDSGMLRRQRRQGNYSRVAIPCVLIHKETVWQTAESSYMVDNFMASDSRGQ